MRPVRDTMSESQDKRKEQVDANGRGCIESLNSGNEVVLNAKRLLTNVILAVIHEEVASTLHQPSHSGTKDGDCLQAQSLRKFSTHSVFNSGSRMPYRNSSLVRLVAFEPPWVAVPQSLHPRQDIELFYMKDVSLAPRHVVKSPLTPGRSTRS